jgi:hypothetical protein
MEEINTSETPENMELQAQKEIREKVIATKKTTFILFSGIVGTVLLSLLIILVLFGAYLFVTRKKPTDIEKVVVPGTETQNVKPEVTAKWTNFENTDLKFKIRYLDSATVTETTESLGNKYRLSIVKQDSPNTGYSFNLSIPDLDFDLNNMVNFKLNAIKGFCPSTSTISSTAQTTVDGINAVYFTTTDCFGGNTYTYFVKNSNVFEIHRNYKGEVWNIDAYKNITDEILSSLEFQKIVDPASAITYSNPRFKFKFVHTGLTQDCCEVKVSANLGFEKLAYLGSKQDNMALGVYRVSQKNLGYEGSINTALGVLKNEYLTLYPNGAPLTPQREDTTVGTARAVIASGYNKSTDVYMFIEVENTLDLIILVFQGNNKTDIFEENVRSIRNTFEFYQ